MEKTRAIITEFPFQKLRIPYVLNMVLAQSGMDLYIWLILPSSFSYEFTIIRVLIN